MNAHTKLTQTGSVVGTPSYMALEQLCGARSGPAADVYAAGVILFELLSGERPFRGINLADSVVRMATQPPRRWSHPGAEEQRALEAIVRRCLLPEPAQRYANGQELLEALLALTPPKATPAKRLVPPRTHRHQTAAWILVSLAIALAFLAGWMARRPNADTSPAPRVTSEPAVTEAAPTPHMNVEPVSPVATPEPPAPPAATEPPRKHEAASAKNVARQTPKRRRTPEAARPTPSDEAHTPAREPAGEAAPTQRRWIDDYL